MPTTKPATIAEFLAALPPDRREAIEAVRKTILKHLDKHYVEQMQYGMISYVVPHSILPEGYHCDPKQPLNFASIGSTKGHMALHMMSVYMNPPLQKFLKNEWAKTGKKLDMGAACIRFKKLDDLPLDVLGKVIAKMPVKTYVEMYRELLARRPAATKKTIKKAK